MRKQANQHVPAEARFDANYTIEPNSGCWLWTGAASPRPRLNINGRPVRAYRYSFERFVGPIPAGMMVCHKCNVELCVNPDHLYAGTARDNMRDAIRAGTHVFVAQNNRLQRLAQEAIIRSGVRKRAMPQCSRLTPAQWTMVGARIEGGENPKTVAADFGISRQAALQMIARQRRRELTRIESNQS